MLPRIFIIVVAVFRLVAQERTLASVVPSLAYGPACTSEVQLENLSDRTVTVELEGHRESGALVGIVDPRNRTVQLSPGEKGSYKLDISEETTSAWARIREIIPSPDLQPAIAVSATTECVAGNELRSVTRPVVYPTRNPWFDGEVDEMPGNKLSLINTSEAAVRVSGCYSSGGLYSEAGKLRPICTATIDMQVPPFNSREFAVTREGNLHFSLRTQGQGIVLEMLRPVDEKLRLYAVDSSITFGDEATARE